MNKKIILLSCLLLCAANIFSQENNNATEKVKAQIIALEKAGWEAWKNNDATWFKINTADSFISVNADGISNKSQVIQSINDCNVKSVSLDDFTFQMLDEKTILLTYIITEDGICGNIQLPAKLRIAVNYVKKNSKWLEAFYMEMPLNK